MLYRSPLPSGNDLPVYILDAAAFSDTKTTDYNALLPYVLARLPDEQTLIGGQGYEVVFFAGGPEDRNAPGESKPGRPGWSWIMQAYQALSRAMRKRLQHLYLVHEKRWVRVLSEMFSAVVSPKFRRKVAHAGTLSALALHIPIEDLLIPPSAYAFDRRRTPSIHAPYATGKRAFGVSNPLPTAKDGSTRLPRVLRETTSFVLASSNIGAEGLFRVNARATSLDILKEAFDRGQKFILWKEGDFAMTFPHHQEGHGEVMVTDFDAVDGWGLNTAAGLIKTWYGDLREPIFPQSSYMFLQRSYGDASEPIDLSTFVDLIVEKADWSPIPKSSRAILTHHLFPLLSTIHRHEGNRMDARNLAVCFAPCVIRGSDPIEDAKMTATIVRILKTGISKWDTDLAALCGMDDQKFHALLQLPVAAEDREDPIDKSPDSPTSHGNQTEGIAMLDDADTSSADEDEGEPPPLPPRVPTGEQTLAPVAEQPLAAPSLGTIPAPAEEHPPRYSTIASPQDGISALAVGALTLDMAFRPVQNRTSGGDYADAALAVNSGKRSSRTDTMSTEASDKASTSPLTSLGSTMASVITTPATASSISRKPLP